MHIDPMVSLITMLGEVRELGRHTAAKVDTIEGRQGHVLNQQHHMLRRLERVETHVMSATPRPARSPAGSSSAPSWRGVLQVAAATAAAIGGFLANLQADQLGTLVKAALGAALKAGGSP